MFNITHPLWLNILSGEKSDYHNKIDNSNIYEKTQNQQDQVAQKKTLFKFNCQLKLIDT